MTMRIDHVIYATADLDAAAARVEAAIGIAARGGGHHDRIGTHNRIVPLGGGYLELLAVADADEVARILRVQDRRVDVVAGEGADRVDRVPQRQGDELGAVAVVVPEQPCAEVARRAWTGRRIRPVPSGQACRHRIP